LEVVLRSTAHESFAAMTKPPPISHPCPHP